MKIKEGFICSKIADTDVVFWLGNNIADFNGVISLNETAAFLWNCLKEEIELPQLVEAVIQKYNISKDTVQKDVEHFLLELKRKNMLEEHLSL